MLVLGLAALADPKRIEPAGGRCEKRDLWDDYRTHVFATLDPKIISGERRVKVVIDASNGMAGTMVPRLFDGVAGLDIVPLYFDNSSGEFVHEPNPLVDANLVDLQKLVVAEKADLGICFDGDADRCMVVDEQGTIVGCDLLTGWLAQLFLQRDPGSPIVFDLRSSKSVSEMVREAGGTPVRSRVGHVFMKKVLAEQKGIFGGELSGHFYFRDNFFTDSGPMAFTTVVSALAAANEPMSTLISPARRYVQSGEINFETEDKHAAMAALVNAYPGADVDELDGVTVDLGDWWCNVRASNTEPLLRLNLEGPDAGTVDERVNEVSQYLGERVAH